MLQKFKEIANAWIIAKNPSKEQKILAENRFIVCDTCPSKKTLSDKIKISTICSECNLKKQYRKFIPVLLHNLKGYDSHFIIPALNSYGYKQESSKNISCIPCNEEKYISFSKMIKVDSYKIKEN